MNIRNYFTFLAFFWLVSTFAHAEKSKDPAPPKSELYYKLLYSEFFGPPQEFIGPPDIDDKSQSSFKTEEMALIGGQGVGLVLSLWSASKVERLAGVLTKLNDSTSTHLGKKLIELAEAKKAHATIMASLANDVNASMPPTLKGDFDILYKEQRYLKNYLRRVEIVLSGAEDRIKSLQATPVYSADAAISILPEKRDAISIKTRSENKIRELKIKLEEIEAKLAQLFKQNEKVYPTYRKYLLSKSALQTAILGLDAQFSSMLSKSLKKLLSLHTTKTTLKFSKKPDAKSINLNNARITYITASGFMVAGIGYTLWTTLSEAEAEADKLVLDVKEIIEDDDLGDSNNEIDEE